MNKRGQTLSLKWLVEHIPVILVVIVLIAVLAAAILIFTSTPKTPAEQDFQRITGEIDDLIKMPYTRPLDITTPVIPLEPYKIVFYPSTDPDLPKRCQGTACICLYEVKENQYVETCKKYEKITPKCETSQCGGICLETRQTIDLGPSKNTVAIVRNCNAIFIT